MDVPGISPTLPEMTDGPVLVIADPASTANGAAVPSPTVGVAALANVTSKDATVRAHNTPTTNVPGDFRRWRKGLKSLRPNFFCEDEKRERMI